MRYLSFIIIGLIFTLETLSQDKIYLTSGTKINAKVTEIGTVNIKYKDASNLDGPNYVVSKQDIVLIEYQNGVIDVLNDNPRTTAPTLVENEMKTTEVPLKKKPTSEKTKQELNLYYLNNSMISINALALANGDLTFMYDHDFMNNHLSATFLGGYNFNSRMGGLNLAIADSKSAARKKFDIGAGLNVMPRNNRRVQYFAGLLVKYMAYNYKDVIDTTNNQKIFKDAKAYQIGVMISNGWVFKISPSFNFKLFGAIGAPINSTALDPRYNGLPKVYLGYCFGYRF